MPVGQSGGGADNTKQITFRVDNGGVAIPVGLLGYMRCWNTGEIVSATVQSGNGTCQIDVWKKAFVANSLPTVADTIVAADPPRLTGIQTQQQDTVLTGWNTAVTAGDCLGFHFDSGTCTSFTLTLEILL